MMVTVGNAVTSAHAQIPVTGSSAPDSQPSKMISSLPSFRSFVQTVADGDPTVRGVYIPEVMALEVVQQPKDQPAFVSIEPKAATQFQMASAFGTIGLLAHNFLAGRYFDDVQIGDKISVVHGDGQVEEYQISSILQFQALDTTNTRTDFVDTSTQKQITASELFNLVYGGKPHLTLQTCIAKGQLLSWGRLFVIAEPVETTGGTTTLVKN